MNDKQLEKVRKGDFLLLPHYMKWMGIPLVLIGAALFFSNENQEFFHREVAAELSGHLVLLGFLIFILSKDKFPDERLLNLRHKAMAYAFMHGMIIVVLVPLFNFSLSSLIAMQFVSTFTGLGTAAIIIIQFLYVVHYWRFKIEL